MTLKAPFQYFGGKSRIASVVWQALGDVGNYVEPFAGSLAVLLARPEVHAAKIETVSDADGLICNFWRAIQKDPDAVSFHADHPVIMADFHARNEWLIGRRESLTQAQVDDPDFFDAKSAGWWVWGQSMWIRGGWSDKKVRPLPIIASHGQGVHSMRLRDRIREEFRLLADRLRNVRVCYGDWARVVGSAGSVFSGQKTAGVFLDPPYASDRCKVYSHDSFDNSRVLKWCIEWQDKARIVLAGHEGEYDLPGWRKVEWKGSGYMAKGEKVTRSRENVAKERLWFSPMCNDVDGQLTL